MPDPLSPYNLHQHNPTTRFDDRASDYRRFRPSYPAPAIDALLADLPAPVRAADIGAGTGISAALLAHRGVDVVAIEPNAAMRAQAETHPRITWLDATAERTTLPDASVSLVLCAQAFHWFDADAALREFHRILRPSGRVALVWNDRDESDPFTRTYSDLLRVASDHNPAMENHTRPEPLFASSLFTNARAREFPGDQPLDADGLIGRAMSASYAPKSGPAHTALLAGLHAAHARFADRAGIARLRYITRVFLADHRPA
jgi:SAM-dependent methyltransferase